jgi:hypothetical protein
VSGFYEDVLEALHSANVRFVVVGGLAVILHGVPRTTADLDLVLDLERQNVLRFIEALQQLGFRPRAPVAGEDLADDEIRRSWVRDKHLKAFTMTRGGIEDVDVVLESPLDHDALKRSSVAIESGRLTLYVAGIDALIEMKLRADREQDRADVAALRRVKDLVGIG